MSSFMLRLIHYFMMSMAVNLEKTLDPHVDIVERAAGYVAYLSDAGERWRIQGECNRCGICFAGAHDQNIAIDERILGQPGAVTFLDGSLWYQRPVRPEIANLAECVLTGDYDVC
jgi:hypothetical protein